MRHVSVATWLSPASCIANRPRPPSRTPRPTAFTASKSEILRKVERLRAAHGSPARALRTGRQGRAGPTPAPGSSNTSRSRACSRPLRRSRANSTTARTTTRCATRRTIITDLEQLLNILLDRQSLENLDDQIEQTQAMIRTGRRVARTPAGAARDQANQARSEQTLPRPNNATPRVTRPARERTSAAESDETSNARPACRLPTLEAALSPCPTAPRVADPRTRDRPPASQLDGAPRRRRPQGSLRTRSPRVRTTRDHGAPRRRRGTSSASQRPPTNSATHCDDADAERIRERPRSESAPGIESQPPEGTRPSPGLLRAAAGGPPGTPERRTSSQPTDDATRAELR